MYGAHLESELKSETSGNFKRLLTSLCTAARDESGRIDPNMAKQDARELLKAGELRVGTDESMFNMILCQRNYQQLKLVSLFSSTSWSACNSWDLCRYSKSTRAWLATLWRRRSKRSSPGTLWRVSLPSTDAWPTRPNTLHRACTNPWPASAPTINNWFVWLSRAVRWVLRTIPNFDLFQLKTVSISDRYGRN